MVKRGLVPRTALVILALLAWTSMTIPPVPRAHAATANITLVGVLGGWNGTTSNPNPTISVVVGDTLSISLSSRDVQHQFYVDVDRDNQSEGRSCLGGPTGLDKCSYYFPPSTIYNFTVDFVPGKYTYFCSFHPDLMFGRFVVAAPPAKNFAISASPRTLSIPSGSSSSSTITLQSLNGFAGNLTLTAGSTPDGLGESFSVDPVMLTSNGEAMSMITVSSPSGTAAGSYQVSVTATNGTLTHSTSITVSASDFNLSTSVSDLTIVGGSSKTLRVSLTSLNGFVGDVSLSMFSSPMGLSLTSSLSTITLASGGSGSATVTVSTSGGAYNNAAALGDYNVTVRASSGQTIHFLIVRVIVSAPSQVSEGGSSLPLLAGGLLAVAAAVVVAVFTVFAWRRRAK